MIRKENVVDEISIMHEALGKVVEIVAKGSETEHIVDLIQAEQENKIVKLPCRVDDFVYYIEHDIVRSDRVVGFLIGNINMGNHIITQRKNFAFKDLGKTVFLSKEEAEKCANHAENQPKNVEEVATDNNVGSEMKKDGVK